MKKNSILMLILFFGFINFNVNAAVTIFEDNFERPQSPIIGNDGNDDDWIESPTNLINPDAASINDSGEAELKIESNLGSTIINKFAVQNHGDLTLRAIFKANGNPSFGDNEAISFSLLSTLVVGGSPNSAINLTFTPDKSAELKLTHSSGAESSVSGLPVNVFNPAGTNIELRAVEGQGYQACLWTVGSPKPAPQLTLSAPDLVNIERILINTNRIGFTSTTSQPLVYQIEEVEVLSTQGPTLTITKGEITVIEASHPEGTQAIDFCSFKIFINNNDFTSFLMDCINTGLCVPEATPTGGKLTILFDLTGVPVTATICDFDGDCDTQTSP